MAHPEMSLIEALIESRERDVPVSAIITEAFSERD